MGAEKGACGPLYERIEYLYDKTDFARTVFEGLVGYTIIAADFDGNILALNEGGRRMYGYSPEEAGRMTIEQFFPQDFAASGGLQSVVGLLMREGRFERRGESVRKGGDLFPVFEVWTLTRGRDGNVEGLVVIVEDLTEREKAEEAIRSINAELEGRVARRTADLKRMNEALVMMTKTLQEEKEITSDLLMVAEASARTTDIERLVQDIVRAFRRVMRCDVALAYLWEREGRRFTACHADGLDAGKAHMFRAVPLDEEAGYVKEAVEKREAVVISGSDSPLVSWLPDLRTAVSVPLAGKKRLLGLVLGLYGAPREFSDRDMNILGGVARQASVSLEEAELYRESLARAMELSHKVETIQAMREIDRHILSTLDRRQIMETATHMLGRLIACDRATLATVDRETGTLMHAAGWGAEEIPKGTAVPFDETNATDVVRTKRAVSRPDLSQEAGLLPLDRRFYELGFRSDLRVPIVIQGEVEALLCVGSRRPGAFRPEDVATMEGLAAQIGVAMENGRLVEEREKLFLSTVRALSAAIDAKSPWTKGHSERVTEYALWIGGAMEIDEGGMKTLHLAGLLHDIGKIGTYESLLDKPGRLTPEEYEIVKAHPAKGSEILAPIRQLKDVIPGVRHHHERWDGTGYPDGLKGEAIPFFGRILAVADTYDSITADRPYRKSPGHAWAIEEIRRCSETQFDPKIARVFVEMMKWMGEGRPDERGTTDERSGGVIGG